MTLATATRQTHVRPGGAALSAWRETSIVSPRHLATARVAALTENDGLYGVVRRWPTWVRLLFIGALGLAVWTSVILTALPLLR